MRRCSVAAVVLLAAAPVWGLSAAPLSQSAAKAELAAHGYAHVRRVQAIGDYWQGKVETAQGPVTVYALNDGQVLREPPQIGAP